MHIKSFMRDLRCDFKWLIVEVLWVEYDAQVQTSVRESHTLNPIPFQLLCALLAIDAPGP